MMRSLWFVSLGLLVGCISESWVYAPTVSATQAVEEGTTVVEGEAVLTWDGEGVPYVDGIVSNALRLEVTSSRRETLVLEYPEANPRDLGTFQEPNALNLNGVYADCGELRCELVVPFRIVRERSNPAEIEVTGDAILSAESVTHRTSPKSDAASLEVLFY